MPFGFGIRIMPGVRLRASTRGIGVGIGPRAARVNVGTRGVGVSTGVGPFWASTGVGRKRSPRRSRQGSTRQSLRDYDRELKRAQREQEVAKVAKTEQQLISVHLEEFPPAQPQLAPEPEPVDRHAVLNDFTNRALSDISWYKLSERRAAKQTAVQQAEHAIREEEHRRAKEREEEQARLDSNWHQLLNNDPQTVLTVLEEAFEDNQAPAAPINCEGDEATVMVLYESPDLVPERKPALTPTGKPTLHKRSKTERNEFYAASLASNVLATVKEAFAVAPSINRVAMMVVRKEEAAQLPRAVLSCLYCGRFKRDLFERLDWSRIDPLEEIYNTPGAFMKRKGRAAEISPLDISDAPDLTAVLRSAAEALGCEAHIMPVDTKRRSDARTDARNRPPTDDRHPPNQGTNGWDIAMEACRPHTLSEFIGQEEALKENLRISVEAAKRRGKTLDHMLLTGPSGSGKTSLCRVLAAEMGVGIQITSGPSLERAGDLAAIFTALEEGDFLLIEDIHLLNQHILEEVLYTAMKDFAMDIVLGQAPSARTMRVDVPRFTLVGETRHTDLPMKKPFSDMFGFNARFDYYSLEDLKKIVVRTATILKVPITLGGAEVIAIRSRGIPRYANQLVLHVRDYAEVDSDGTIDEATVRVVLS